MNAVWVRVKVVAAWAWNWITVLAATMLGTLSMSLDYIEQLSGVDYTQIMTQRRAAQITFGVAVTKAIVAAYNSQKAKTSCG